LQICPAGGTIGLFVGEVEYPRGIIGTLQPVAPARDLLLFDLGFNLGLVFGDG
jgi:hypothetical protein